MNEKATLAKINPYVSVEVSPCDTAASCGSSGTNAFSTVPDL